jgi:hypothetical protein
MTNGPKKDVGWKDEGCYVFSSYLATNGLGSGYCRTYIKIKICLVPTPPPPPKKIFVLISKYKVTVAIQFRPKKVDRFELFWTTLLPVGALFR